MELGATVCRPRASALFESARSSGGCARPIEAPPQRARGVRFEDTDRFARGRVVAALLAGEEIPFAGSAASASWRASSATA